MSILDTIQARKWEEIEERKNLRNIENLQSTPHYTDPRFSMSEFIKNGSGIISEFKRKSPSKPEIALDANVADVALAYAENGASGMSILTDLDFFGGHDMDVVKVRPLINIPILRKEFILDPYQIVEARAIGADCILLIAEILSKTEVKNLAKFAYETGLEVILEVHTQDQIKKYNDYIQIIGVNNRDLKTFTTDIEQSIRLFNHLPSQAIKISESGLSTGHEAKMLKSIGYNGFLVGESFMKNSNPGLALSTFIKEMKA